MNLEFDKKLGPDFIGSVPDTSGIYIFRNDEGEAIYVGKAKSLKRRLAQYRLATRKKAFRKMRTIVSQAASLEFQICASEQAALLLENQLIVLHRPKLNVVGAFSFLYPYLGLKADPEKPLEFTLCHTTSPDILQGLGFELFGAYRSRATVRDAYEALSCLLAFIGHPTPAERKRYGPIPYTGIISFRQMEKGWRAEFEQFFRGESSLCLDRLIQELLEKPDARQQASAIQEHLKNLKYFFRFEAKKLRAALDQQGIRGSMIRQEERDRIFLSQA